jgi:hypothetical protein
VKAGASWSTVTIERYISHANFSPKHLELKKGDTVKEHDNLIAICWKDEREVYMLPSAHSSSKWDFLRQAWKCQKTSYDQAMVYANKSDRVSHG